MRLNKFISIHSEYSRRKADELIAAGKVKVNNTSANLGATINPESDSVSINNKTLTQSIEKLYIALNKPASYVTTRSDELSRKTVMELVPKNKNLKPAGRLDQDTEGLLILSNDGDFINRLIHPSFECEKEYQAKIGGLFTPFHQKKLENGMIIDGHRTSKAKIAIIKQSENETLLRIVIHEGRNRQIRKMFAQIRCHVKYLQRIRIGKIKLGELKVGDFRPLTPEEINVK